MGKLHKIRKAVEKNPERFVEKALIYWRATKGMYTGRSRGATVCDLGVDNTGNGKRWPCRYDVLSTSTIPSSSYHKYIASILRKLGYPV